MTSDIWYIYGAGGLGAETMDILQTAIDAGALPGHKCAFLVDDPSKTDVNGYPVHAFSDHVPGSKVTIAVGEPYARKALLEKIETADLALSTVISPTAFVSPSAEIENGVIIAPLCSIQSNAKVGKNAAINTMTIIGHDVKVEESCVISSQVNLGGAVRVGKFSYVGMGALVKEKLEIGHSSIVGMGSVVHRDIPDEVIALGNPARVARRNEDKKVFK